MQQRLLGSAAVIALTLGISNISTAQTPTTPQWSVITAIQIKPEFRQEMEAIHKEISAAYKKANVNRLVVQTILGDLDEYISIAPLTNFAELDGPSVLEKAMGAAKSQMLLKRIGGYIVAAHRTTYLDLPDISIRTEMANPGEYAHVTVFHLAHGKGAAFTQYMKDDYLPAMRKADVANLWLSEPVFGGSLDDRVMVRPLHKLAEVDGGPVLTKALGAEGAAKITAKQNGIVESVHYSIVRVRPELSYMPAPPAKAKASE